MRSGQNKYWLLVVLAGCFEVIWVMGLKHAQSPLFWSVTIAAILISFWLLIYTASKLPTSTAYAVFVGLGTVGTVIVEMTIYNEPFSLAKIGLIALLLVGILGLKFVTADNNDEAQTDSGQGRGTGA